MPHQILNKAADTCLPFLNKKSARNSNRRTPFVRLGVRDSPHAQMFQGGAQGFAHPPADHPK